MAQLGDTARAARLTATGDFDMATARVTIIDPLSSDSRKQQLAIRLSDVLVSPDDDLRDPAQWHVIAEAVRPHAAPSGGPNRRIASLNAAAWHAHLSGARRWVPDGR
jgi:hypothetical protein